jgi:hypothetical protein
MSYGSISGRARTSSVNPQAHAICDRGGFRYNHVNLQFQFDWAGATVQNKRILVCQRCLDQMQSQLRSLTLPGDPPPILNPRPELYATDGTNYRVTSGMDTVNTKTGIPVPGGDFRITEDDSNRVTQQTGFASGSRNEEPGTDPNAPGDNDPGLPYGNTSVPETGPI